MQVSARALPATVSDRLAEASSWMVMAPEVAVKPLTVAGVEGSDSDTPASGTGLGMGTLKLSGPSEVVAGVAPLASIWAVAEPVRLGCSGRRRAGQRGGQVHHRLVARRGEGLARGRVRPATAWPRSRRR